MPRGCRAHQDARRANVRPLERQQLPAPHARKERRVWIARRNKALVRKRDRERYQRDRDVRIDLIKRRPYVKRRARWLVYEATTSGRLVPPPACEGCGKDRPLQAHHHDYTKPLDVKWLCAPCHGKKHRKQDHEFVGWTGGNQ